MFNLFKKAPEVSAPAESGEIVYTQVVKRTWRNNMWVMTPRGVGVLFELGEPCVVHLADKEGFFKESWSFPTLQIRQANWEEIPIPRRGCSRERGYFLGYA